MSDNTTARADFGIFGLGVMGSALAENVAGRGLCVAVANREPEAVAALRARRPELSLVLCADLPALVAALRRPRRLLLMIKAGPPVDETLAKVLPLCEPGDVLVDGGNSWFEDSERRQAVCAARGVHLVGLGVSGGEEGARHGPSLMPGGSPEAYALLAPVLEAIAARTEAGPCVTHVGPGGAGHFVKMVHNGIEYADMQLIAEVYDLLRRRDGMAAAQIGALFGRWNDGPLGSFLIELTGRLLAVRDPETGAPLVDLVEDQAGQKGTGQWTVQAALTLGVPVPTVAAALDARLLSANKRERQLAAAALGETPGPRATSEPWLAALHQALYGAKICAYAQGLALCGVASAARGWRLDLGELARIWKGGCIIRARLLDELRAGFARRPELPNLLLDPALGAAVRGAAPGLRTVVAEAAAYGVPVPALGAALAYFDAYRSARLPQNLIQAQRDAFGAHTYQRVDHPERGFVHTDWLGLAPRG